MTMIGRDAVSSPTATHCDVCHMADTPDNRVTVTVTRGLALVVCTDCAERGLRPTVAHRVRRQPAIEPPTCDLCGCDNTTSPLTVDTWNGHTVTVLCDDCLQLLDEETG